MHTSQNEGIAPIYHLVCFCASMACFAVALAGDAKTVREIRAAQRLWRKEVLPYYVTMGLVLVFCAFVYTSSQMLVHGATDQTNPIRVFAIESLLENPAKPLAAREFLEQQNRD